MSCEHLTSWWMWKHSEPHMRDLVLEGAAFSEPGPPREWQKGVQYCLISLPKPSNRTDPWDHTEPIHIISVPAQLQMKCERFMATGNRKPPFISLNHKELYHVTYGKSSRRLAPGTVSSDSTVPLKIWFLVSTYTASHRVSVLFTVDWPHDHKMDAQFQTSHPGISWKIRRDHLFLCLLFIAGTIPHVSLAGFVSHAVPKPVASKRSENTSVAKTAAEALRQWVALSKQGESKEYIEANKQHCLHKNLFTVPRPKVQGLTHLPAE